ncbi:MULTISPECIES: cation:proton antiporter [Snodgrassella]|uniref:cation:proton antiporter domain-containing protein n=1 Tax=unclassified Snodgrassella TaxID=2625236 RepID=UPI0018DB13A2|nr:cation:proton antiporter [Snodgrassella alvi]MBI0098188.1 cation:proton antiporter [Snodgrassella sp. W8134]MBI0101976.1 cation:proton antiporter [Snodgrassella sp. W8135]
MMHISLGPVVMILLVAVLASIICRRLHIPAMLGYLVVGFIAGPGWLHLINQSHATEFIGEIGITFLMFSIGLEFSIGKLKAMRRLVLGLGGLQVALTLLILFILFAAMRIQLTWAFTLAAAMTMSSTAIVSRIMVEKNELGQHYGHMIMGVLLMQDIAVVPLMILLPALAHSSDGLILQMGKALLTMALALGLLLVVGSKIMPMWFRLIARTKSSELFMINVLLVTLGVAYLTQLAGLSLALGAFVAGMLISETEYRYQVEDDIRPFRDILLGFFFITIGMKLNIQVLQSSWLMILILGALLVILKAAVLFGISRYMKENTGDSIKTALYLAQGGEFGFVMLAISGALKLISLELQQAAIAAILLSMILAPFIMRSADKINKLLVKRSWDEQAVDLQSILVDTMSKSDHILIIGFGRCGQSIARILQQEDTPYYAIDLDAERVATAKAAGEPVTFGDAKRQEVLQAAGLKRANTVLITINNMTEAKHILNNIMLIAPTMPVIVRVTNDDNIPVLTNMGADDIVSDEKESSLTLASQALLSSGKPFDEVYQIMQRIRQNRYQALEGLFAGSDDTVSDENIHYFRQAFTLPPDAFLVGKSIDDLPQDKLKVKLLSVRRNAHQLRKFDSEFRFKNADTLVVLGPRDKVILFENWSLQGTN